LATLAEAIDLKDPVPASSELVFRLLLKLMIAGREHVDEERRHGEALVGAVAAAGGGAAAQLRPPRSATHKVQDGVGGS